MSSSQAKEAILIIVLIIIAILDQAFVLPFAADLMERGI